MRPIFHPVTHGSPEWVALRRTGVGASEIPIITGDAPWGDIRTVYQDKLGWAAAAVATRVMESGQRLEDAVLRWYNDEKGLRAHRVRGVYRHAEEPIVLASLDGMTMRRPRQVVEVKVADSPGDAWGIEGTDQVPDHYREQVEWEMLASGLDEADIAVLFVRYRRLAVYHVARDTGLADQLLRYGIEFWQHVEARTPPEPPAQRRSRLIALRDDEIEADDALNELVGEVYDARSIYEEAKTSKEQLEGRLRERLADVGGAKGAIPDGPAYSVSYRYTRDGREVAWELLVNELRARLIDAGASEEELDEITEDYTAVRAGPRPLRLSVQKEKHRARVA